MIPGLRLVLLIAAIAGWSGFAPTASAADLAPLPEAPVSEASGPAAQAKAWGEIHVQFVAHDAANLGAPMAGRLVEFPLRDGDRFAQGATLARFACNEQQAALVRARATLTEKQQILSTDSRLHSLGTGSGLDMRVAQAQVAEAGADVQMVSAQINNCVVEAPFAGRVAGVSVRPFQFVGLGQPLLEILDDNDLDIELIVPSRWLAWLTPGYAFDVTVEETGHSYKAAITRLSGKVDPVSQTIKAYARLTEPAANLLAGMSGRVKLQPPAGATPSP